MLSRKYCGFNRFGGCGQEHWPLKIDHIWMVNCHTQMVSTDGFGNGTMVVAGFGFYNVLQLVLCLIMKIPMKQPVQGISERFLPLFGWFEGKSIFGAAFRVLIICLLLKQILVGARNGQDFHGFPPSPRDGFLEYAGRRFSVEDLIQMSAVSCDLCHRSIQEDLWGTHGGPRDQEEIGGSAM